MTPLSPEQREYKEVTLRHLLANLPQLEMQLAAEKRPDEAASLTSQLEDIEAHIDLLQRELAANASIEPVADGLCQQAAQALVKKKFYLARKYITKLEAIEPFYPVLDRLRQDAESGQASRRVRAITQGNMPSLRPLLPAAALSQAAPGAGTQAPAWPLPTGVDNLVDDEPSGPGGLRQYFQLHIVLSCLVVALLLCVMSGVGGVYLLQWLVEGH